MPDGSPDRVDDLYGLPLEEFIAARNALAKELTKEGDKATAAEVKKLPKPNKAAWALNQVARQQPDEIDLLLQAGEKLQTAQRLALEGDASHLRPATRSEQDQVNRLVESAAQLAGPGAEDRLRATLRAAATDPAAGALLRQGRLIADIESSGFGLDGLPDIAFRPPAAPDDTAAAAPREQERERQQAIRDAEHLRKQADIEGNRAQRMQDEADRLDAQAHEARRRAEDAQTRATQAYRRAEEAAKRAGL